MSGEVLLGVVECCQESGDVRGLERVRGEGERRERGKRERGGGGGGRERWEGEEREGEQIPQVKSRRFMYLHVQLHCIVADICRCLHYHF